MSSPIKAKQNKIFGRLLFFFGLLVFVIFIFGLIREIINHRQINQQLNGYAGQISRLKTENGLLNDKIGAWRQSSELEASARAKLGLEKPGEQTIVIIRPASVASQQVAVKSNQEIIDFNPDKLAGAYQSNPVKWWQYFFNN